MTTVLNGSILLDMSGENTDYRAQRSNWWYWRQSDDGLGSAVLFTNAAYRGQTNHHDPMLPAAARGLQNLENLTEAPTQDQAEIILRLARMWWFERQLDYHPVAKHAEKEQLTLNRSALAQHYGLPTQFLDLTDDFDVAAFFATCRPTDRGWAPMESGVGVIYRVDFDEGFSNPIGGRYEPLGPQPLPRPTEQCGWVTLLPMVHSFENWPNVRLMRFSHNKRIGDHYLQQFEGGSALFPPDPLADVAREISDCNEIPGELIDSAISLSLQLESISDEQIPAIRRELSRQVSITEYRRILTDRQVASLMEDFEWRTRMLPEVKAQTVLFKTVDRPTNRESDA